MTGFTSPNYTQVPNDLFDELMSSMSGSELKVILAIVRQTIGYHRENATFSQTKIAEMTGLSYRAVIDAARLAEEHGLIRRTNNGNTSSAEWELIVACEKSSQGHVKKVHKAYEKSSHVSRLKKDKEREEKVIEGGGGDLQELTPPAPPPPTPSWQPDILTQRAERIFRDTTGMIMFPSTDKRDQAIRVCLAYYDREGDEAKATKALLPYWQAWQKYRTKGGSRANRTNLAWLTDWAAAGEIPLVAQVGHVKPGSELVWAEVHR